MLEKAKIYKVDNLNRPILTCLYNPGQLAFSKNSTWTDKSQPDKNIGQVVYGGGQPEQLKIDLFFDTTATGQDVRNYTDALLDLMMVIDQTKIEERQYQDTEWRQVGVMRIPVTVTKTKQIAVPFKAPPLCVFGWGKIKSFVGYFTAVTVKFTLFLPDGTPVRATANTTLKEYIDKSRVAAQNPTSRSVARKTRIVLEGETLDWIAYEEYGDPAYWRHIAQVNRLVNPKDVRPGLVLNLPPLS